MNPAIELVTTGAELLNGRVVNRHAQWLGGELDRLGWQLLRDTTVPDDPEAIREAICSALDRCQVVIVTGGLGPTSDDVTRDVAAAWAGKAVVMHEPSRRTVIEAYRRRNRTLNALVERHALVVEGANVLDNPYGLAPGEHLQQGDRHLFLLPGPPTEFQGVMRDHVLPWLETQGCASRQRIGFFQVIGLGESDIAARLDASRFRDCRLEVAYCAAPARVTIRIHEVEGHESDFDAGSEAIRDVLGPAIASESRENIEQIVVRQLKERGMTVAVAESCTGGLVGQRITSVPGASAVFRGGVIAYHNDLKAGVLGVPAGQLEAHGAVSAPVAAAMAEGVRRVAGSDMGVAITGIAGPEGGTPEKPLGLVFVAVASSSGTETRELRLGGGREVIREASATLALDLLRCRLITGST